MHDSLKDSKIRDLSVEHIAHCSFDYWYPLLQSHTIQSRIIPLDQEIVDYLLADGLILPLNENGQASPSYAHSLNSELSDDEDSEPTEAPPHFPIFQSLMQSAIESLGGSVFPKLNWSCPKDASWIALDGTLKCGSPNDIFLLLKSSDFIVHDLMHAFDLAWDADKALRPGFCLVLRKWCDLNPSLEFRCFVKNRKIAGICQRDIRNFYDFLPLSMADFCDRIVAFYESHVQRVFPDPNFVMDVYINKSNKKVKIIDFNPFSPITDSLLFDWDDLDSQPVTDTPICLVVNSEEEAHNSHAPTFVCNRVPREVIDLSNGASIEEFADRFRDELALSTVDLQ